jgi:hypothetical protein
MPFFLLNKRNAPYLPQVYSIVLLTVDTPSRGLRPSLLLNRCRRSRLHRKLQAQAYVETLPQQRFYEIVSRTRSESIVGGCVKRQFNRAKETYLMKNLS